MWSSTVMVVIKSKLYSAENLLLDEKKLRPSLS